MNLEEEDLVRLRQAFGGPEPPRSPGEGGASAVLLPLFRTRDGLALLYTRRSSNLSSHPGEVSFPGGRIDPGDSGPLAAALREAEEEVGIRPSDVDVVGHLTDFRTFYGRLVSAYVGVVRGDPPAEPVSRDEVDEVFVSPVADLLSPARYEGRRIAGADEDRVVHYWHLPPATVWGITGELTARFLARAYGWRPPRAARVVRDVSEIIPG